MQARSTWLRLNFYLQKNQNIEIERGASPMSVKLFVLNGPGQYYPIDNRKKSEKVEDETRCSFV